MPPLVLYFSMTGNTARLAERLARDLGEADLGSIACPRYEGGASVLRCVWDSLTGATPEIRVPPPTEGRDLVLLGSPVWAGRPAPPLRSFLAKRPRLPERVGIFLTAGSGAPQKGAMRRFSALLPSPETARLVLGEKEVRSDAAGERIATFLATLRA